MKVTFSGFFDLQVNSLAGVDFNTPGHPPAANQRSLDAMRATGFTRYLPTPYRAQIQARTVENTVYVVDAHAPAATMSHWIWRRPRTRSWAEGVKRVRRHRMTSPGF